MSVWDDVVGQEPAVALLSGAACGTATMTHAWLLTGPPGCGRAEAARAFAAALQCDRGGCGACHACRTALVGTHPDVTLVATEHVMLRVDDVKPLIATAQQRPSAGRWRVVVVEDADRLNESSGNLLLKTIEEPPPRTVWVLCAPSADDVLRTIRSRCRHVGLRTPSPQAVAELLVRKDGADPAVAAYAARSAMSHIGVARRLAFDEEARARRREVLRLPGRVTGVGAAVRAAGDLLAVATEEAKAAAAEHDEREHRELLRSLGAEGATTVPPAVRAQVRQLQENQKRRATRAQRDGLDRALTDLSSLYRDVLRGHLAPGSDLVNAEHTDIVDHLAGRADAVHAVRCMESIGQARARIAGNVSPLLALEALMVQLRPPRAGAGRRA